MCSLFAFPLCERPQLAFISAPQMAPCDNVKAKGNCMAEAWILNPMQTSNLSPYWSFNILKFYVLDMLYDGWHVWLGGNSSWSAIFNSSGAEFSFVHILVPIINILQTQKVNQSLDCNSETEESLPKPAAARSTVLVDADQHWLLFLLWEMLLLPATCTILGQCRSIYNIWSQEIKLNFLPEERELPV